MAYFETLERQPIFLEKTPDCWVWNLPFRKQESLHILYVYSSCLDTFSGERTKRLLFVCLVMNNWSHVNEQYSDGYSAMPKYTFYAAYVETDW